MLTDVAKSPGWLRPFLQGRVPDPGAYSLGVGGGTSVWFQNTKQGLITQLPAFQMLRICCIKKASAGIFFIFYQTATSSASKLDIKSYLSQRDRRLEMMY